MTTDTLKSPFPYFGGKSRVASLVWERFGQVQNYVEPFFGSGAVLLGCPHPGHTETVNDIDALLANFWRALSADPEAVATYADWPVNEVDLHARHRYLRDARGQAEALMADPDRYDAKLAGWWVWGISQWIGSGWCPPPSVTDVRQLPHVGNAGMGIHASAFDAKTGGIYDYFQQLAARLRRARVCCGDWRRVTGPSVTYRHGLTAVFLDPPYVQEGRADVYGYESQIFEDVRQWASENGDNPLMRIALCGYDFEMPDGWQCVRWKAPGGYGSQGKGQGRANAHKEMIWFSPHCLDLSALPMFAYLNSEARHE